MMDPRTQPTEQPLKAGVPRELEPLPLLVVRRPRTTGPGLCPIVLASGLPAVGQKDWVIQRTTQATWQWPLSAHQLKHLPSFYWEGFRPWPHPDLEIIYSGTVKGKRTVQKEECTDTSDWTVNGQSNAGGTGSRARRKALQPRARMDYKLGCAEQTVCGLLVFYQDPNKDLKFISH